MHAVLEPDGPAAFLIYDNSSSNGTWKGSRRLTPQARSDQTVEENRRRID